MSTGSFACNIFGGGGAGFGGGGAGIGGGSGEGLGASTLGLLSPPPKHILILHLLLYVFDHRTLT